MVRRVVTLTEEQRQELLELRDLIHDPMSVSGGQPSSRLQTANPSIPWPPRGS
jgi:hypothetical protein